MKLTKIIASSAILALCSTSALAAPAAPASKLSLSPSARVGAPAGRSKAAGAGIFALLIAGGIAGIIGVAISKDDDSDSN